MTLPPEPPVMAHLAASVVRRDILIRFAWIDGTVSRLCSAFGGLRLPADAIETTADAYYSGAPAILDIPVLRQLINGVAGEIELSLSGLWEALRDVAEDEAWKAEGAEINIGRVDYDADWRIVGPASWSFTATGGQVTTEQTGARISAEGDVTPGQIKVSLTAVTQTIRRGGASLSYWSSAQHRLRHPTDYFFDLMNKISIGYVKPFPKL